MGFRLTLLLITSPLILEDTEMPVAMYLLYSNHSPPLNLMFGPDLMEVDGLVEFCRPIIGFYRTKKSDSFLEPVAD